MQDPLSALRNRFDGPLPPGALGSEDHEMTLKAFLGGRRYEARVAGSLFFRERRDEASPSAAMTTRGVVTAFTAALRAGDASLVPTTAEESLQSHLMVFAAERARRQGTVEAIPQR